MDSLRAQSVNQSGSSDPPERIAGLLDINVLPQRYRPSRLSFTTVLAWLMLAVLVGLLYLSFLRFQEGTEVLAAQRMRFQAAQEALQAAEVQPAELEQLRLEIETLNAETVELDRLINQLDIQQIQWGPQLSEIVAQSPPSVELTAIDQSGDEAIFTGRSRAYADALDYQSSLEQSGQYAQVHLLSISRVENESSQIVVSPEAEEDAADENEPASVLSADFLYEFRLLVELNASGAGEQAMEVSQ